MFLKTAGKNPAAGLFQKRQENKKKIKESK